MIRLPVSKEPAWHDLEIGVRLRCRPITTAIIRAAASAAGGADFPDAEILAVRVAHLNREIALRVILDWEGVVHGDDRPAEVTAETITACMDLPRFDAAFEAAVMAPWLAMQTEKKDCAPLPDGSSARAPIIAPTAQGPAPTVRPC